MLPTIDKERLIADFLELTTGSAESLDERRACCSTDTRQGLIRNAFHYHDALYFIIQNMTGTDIGVGSRFLWILFTAVCAAIATYRILSAIPAFADRTPAKILLRAGSARLRFNTYAAKQENYFYCSHCTFRDNML